MKNMKTNKKTNEPIPLSIDSNGKLTGGFASLNIYQMSKINGGKKNPLDDNAYCTNKTTCNESNVSQCTNSGTCG